MLLSPIFLKNGSARSLKLHYFYIYINIETFLFLYLFINQHHWQFRLQQRCLIAKLWKSHEGVSY